MASAAPDACISYSRDDATFVDRLEADLRAHDFDVWVDRSRLEGGSKWEQAIRRAIEQHSLFIVVLSPLAVQSEYVRFEYDFALGLSKRIKPILYKKCSIPAALRVFQWIDFTGTKDYSSALNELLYACQDPTFDLAADSKTLYEQALALKDNDPERAAIRLQRLLERDPGFFGGEVASEHKQLQHRLYASLVVRLRSQAEQARQRGEYGVEARLLELIVALGPQDVATYRWAEEYLPVAQQIESERSTALAPVESLYERRMAEIAAKHRRALAEIAKRYGQE